MQYDDRQMVSLQTQRNIIYASPISLKEDLVNINHSDATPKLECSQSEELEMELLSQSLQPGTKEYESFLLERRVVQYLKEMGVRMKTDPSAKKEKYWTLKRHQRQRTAQTSTDRSSQLHHSRQNAIIARRKNAMNLQSFSETTKFAESSSCSETLCTPRKANKPFIYHDNIPNMEFVDESLQTCSLIQ